MRKQRFFLAILFLMVAIIGNAQSDTIRIAMYIKKGAGCLSKHERLNHEIEKADLDSANYFFDQALLLSRSIAAEKWINNSLMWKGNCYIDANDVDSGRACFQKVIGYYQHKGDIVGEANAWRHLGNCLPSFKKLFAAEKASCLERAYRLYWKGGDSASALESLKAAADARLYEPNIDLAEKQLLIVAANYKAMHFSDIHFTYDLLRVVSQLKGDLVNEVSYTMDMVRSLDSAVIKTREDSLQAGRLYCYAGMTYGYAAMWDRALFFARKGWGTLKFTDSNEEYFTRLASLCLALVRNDSARVGLQLLQAGLRQRDLSNPFEKALIAYVLGICYQDLGEFKKAETEFSKILPILDSDKLFDEPRHLQWRQEMTIAIGNFFLFTHQYDKANFYANRLPSTYTYLTILGQKGRIELLKSRVDSAMGRYRSALTHFVKYQMMNDSLFGIQKTIQIQELQSRYALEKKDNDLLLQGANIKLLTQENELQQMQADQSRNLRNMMVIALLLLIFLAGMFYSRYRAKQRRNRQLELKQDEITAQNHQLEHLLQENGWLLQEVHHRVKNNLQTVTSLLTSQMESAEKGPAVEAIRESRQRIEAIAMIHQRLYNTKNYSSIMMPAYVADLVEHLREVFRPGPRIVFSLFIEPISLDISVALPAALILNEAISNALKHAFPNKMPGTINVRLRGVSENKVMLEVADDGIGFSENSVISSKSFGIRLIKGLVSDVSGESEIINGSGTTVRILFSIETVTGKTGSAQNAMLVRNS